MCICEGFNTNQISNEIDTLQITTYLENSITISGENTLNDHTFEYNCTITEQRMGGASINCDTIMIDGVSYGSLTGNMALWSGGVQHFELENDQYIFSVTQNPDGTFADFNISAKDA
jgi:hypothetical protein